MKKNSNKLLWYLVGIFFLVYLAQQIYWMPGFSWFHNTPLVIDESPVIIKEIKSISELTALSRYSETTVDSSKQKDLPSFPGLRPDPDKLVLIVKGQISAGMDLKQTGPESISIKNDTVYLKLPPCKILHVTINPSGTETFIEEGRWSDDALMQLKLKARNLMITEAIRDSILPKAHIRCLQLMKSFLNTAGFKNVVIEDQSL